MMAPGPTQASILASRRIAAKPATCSRAETASRATATGDTSIRAKNPGSSSSANRAGAHRHGGDEQAGEAGLCRRRVGVVGRAVPLRGALAEAAQEIGQVAAGRAAG